MNVEQMQDLVKNLGQLERNIILSVFLSVFISIISLIINLIFQNNLAKRKEQLEKYKSFSSSYPKLFEKLLKLINCYNILEKNILYTKDFDVIEYIHCNWCELRSKLGSEEINYIDEYEKVIKKIIEIYLNLSIDFCTMNIPAFSIKLQKELMKLKLFCFLISDCNNDKIKIKVDNYKKEDIEILIKYLDEQNNKF